jgi:NDP-sugar pyrophosphorylase family protein
LKTVILAGGLGTRLMEETEARPKPMVEIGGKPILWHIMKIYEAHGFYDFVVCLGYKAHMIKEYFINYYLYNSDVNTLLNFAGIKKDLIAYIVDASPDKQNKYLPGAHIPVVCEEKITDTKPYYVVILPWNHKEERNIKKFIHQLLFES